MLFSGVSEPPCDEVEQKESLPRGRGSRQRAIRSRNWIFTDYSLSHLQRVWDSDRDGARDIRYIKYGVETCPKTGRLHHQGWFQLDRPVSLAGAKLLLCVPGAHFEVMRGSCQENEEYVSKDGDVTTFGSFISMGQRVDVEEIRVLISQGRGDKFIADANFPLWCRFRQSFAMYRMLVLKEDTAGWRGALEVVLLEGRTRCGKTRLAFKYGTYIIGGFQLGWWDGYDGENCIIIDDFADDIPIQQMLRILDGYQLRLPIKGAFTYAQWTRVIITTNVEFLYSQAPAEHLAAFKARISLVVSAWGDSDSMPDCIDLFEAESVNEDE